VWHVSAAPMLGRVFTRSELKTICRSALHHVGVTDKEWEEYTGFAFHLRRLLTDTERKQVPGVEDLRGTSQGMRRLDAIKAELPSAALRLAEEELNGSAKE